jgi:branched-chain amino acid transport system ATP-binding protein
MSVRDNLLMGAYLPAAYAARHRRLADVYRLLPKLEERQAQIASTLSGGERRMLAIGRGLMADCRILLIDEPSLGLAPIVIDQIYEAIAGLRRAGHTILLVEENASRVLGLADTVYLLDNGQMVWQGAAGDLASRPELLATYLGG